MKLYKQEGKFGAYSISLPAIPGVGGMREYLPADFGDLWIHVENRYGTIFLLEEQMHTVARTFFAKADGEFPEGWDDRLNEVDAHLYALSKKIHTLDLGIFSKEELYALYTELFSWHEEMWKLCIFIDAFDAGDDTREIERIQQQHGFSSEETHLLLSPLAPSYLAEWNRALQEYRAGVRDLASLKDQYFWYATDYTAFGELDDTFIEQQLASSGEETAFIPSADQEALLKKRGMAVNPFATFQKLAVWRDRRKRMNFTGFYGLYKLLTEALHRQALPWDLLFVLLPDEAHQAFTGILPAEVLADRRENGMLISYAHSGVQEVRTGQAAQSFLEELKRSVQVESYQEVKGMVASKGFAVGRARVVFKPHEHPGLEFNQGDILVTSMTRPEFIYLMKKAGAIVTDEGGISCHAAIVSRELGVPCVIGTKHATTVFQDGDMVEVDAVKGIVRKINTEK